MTPLTTNGILLSMLSLFTLVSSHNSRKHEQYSFKDLREAVDGDSLSYEDQQRLFDSLKLLNCTESKPNPDYRKCFTPEDLHGSSPPKALNVTEFQEISPVIIFCLLPALELNSGKTRCVVYPKNHSELFREFARNFSEGKHEHEITTHALDHILEEINKTIGEFLVKKKCFSAESIINEVKHEEEEHGHAHEEHNSTEEKSLDQHDFEKASASIIFHLVQGFCIEEGHAHNGSESKLPSKEFFLKEIFGNKTHLSEEDLEKITKVLKIGEKSTASSSHDDHSDHSDHSDHGHKRRRRRSTDFLSQQKLLKSHTIHRRAADSHGHESETHGHHATEATCYSLDDVLTVFDIDHSTGADRYDFQQVCPAFIQQVTSEACKAHQSTSPAPSKDMGKIWGYGIAAVTIISLTSLVGVATIPFLGKTVYKKILAFLVALAVGTLSGDALLHLLPHAFGLHAHDAHESEGTSADAHADHSGENAFLWKALVVLASIYSFFLFETLMHLGLKNKLGPEHGHSHSNVEVPGPSSRHMSFKEKRTCSKFEHHEGVTSFGQSEEKEKAQAENGDIVLTNVEGNKNCNSSPSCSFHPLCVYEHVCATDTEESELFETAKDGLDDYPNGVSQKPADKMSVKSSLSRASMDGDESGKKTLETISAVAWMIIIGDTIHNLSDGLAIGAAFAEGGTSGVSGGISTSIAVFCHELPHELGDFAVLLSAGMSVKKALLANFLSALSCYIGLAIGIYVGQEGEVRFWIFAIAGGMFLYVALVDMLPDLMHSEALQTDPMVTFLLQNLGLLLGFVIMLIIALYEEDLMAIKF